MAAVLNVSRSGYYSWIKAGCIPDPRALARQERDRKVKEAFDKNKQRDGARRILVELAENGDQHDVKNHCRQSAQKKPGAKSGSQAQGRNG